VADSVGMTSAIGSALAGVSAGFARLDRTADRIARSTDGEGLPGHMVDLRRARHEVRANLTTLRTADEVVGSILDVVA
jgi:hypothetical protein